MRSKAIVFAGHVKDTLIFGGATQKGFHTHLFGSITTGPDGSTSYATTMAEAGMQAVEIRPSTAADIAVIHQDCVNFPPVGPLQ